MHGARRPSVGENAPTDRHCDVIFFSGPSALTYAPTRCRCQAMAEAGSIGPHRVAID
jgi:hypothetical protein